MRFLPAFVFRRAQNTQWLRASALSRFNRATFINTVAMLVLVAAPLQAKTKPRGTNIGAGVVSVGHATDTYAWTIGKSAQPTAQNVASGNSGQVTWTITVTKGAAVSAAYFDGQVCVINTGRQPTQGLTIQAQLSKPPSSAILATSAIDVSAHPVLAAGENWCYPYQIAVPTGSITPGATYKVTAQVTITNRSGKVGTPTGVSAKTSAKLPSPTVVNGTITVTDTNGQTFDFSASGSPSYSQTVQCSTADDDSQTLNNIATITNTGQTASATASVTCTARTISGTGAIHYFSEASASSIASVPIDFSGQTVEAIVRDSGGNLVAIAGSGAQGMFSVSDVPPGQYMLHVGKTYLVTDVNEVALDGVAHGRPTATAVTQDSFVNVGVGNLDTWQAYDFLEFYAPAVGDWDFVTDRFDNSLADGDTSVSLAINLSRLDASFPQFHIDAAAGDHAYLAQLSLEHTSTSTSYLALTRTFTLPAFSSVDGGSVSAGDYPPNTFASVSRNQSVNVDFRGAEFLATLTADGNPNQTFASCGSQCAQYAIVSLPGTNLYGASTASADQLIVGFPVDGTNVTTGAMSYGVLPTGHWGEYVDVRFQSQMSYALPGATPSFPFPNGLLWTPDPSIGTMQTIRPQLSPPRNIKVDGSNFFSNQTLGSVFPTITWSPPAIGAANYYRLTVYELFVDGGNRTQRLSAPTILYTPNTSIELPGFLQYGHNYVIVLDAFGATADPPLDVAKPLQGRINSATATVSSGILTP